MENFGPPFSEFGYGGWSVIRTRQRGHSKASGRTRLDKKTALQEVGAGQVEKLPETQSPSEAAKIRYLPSWKLLCTLPLSLRSGLNRRIVSIGAKLASQHSLLQCFDFSTCNFLAAEEGRSLIDGRTLLFVLDDNEQREWSKDPRTLTRVRRPQKKALARMDIRGCQPAWRKAELSRSILAGEQR